MQPLTTTLEPAWIVRPRPQAQASVRLVCLPYGGGGASAYHSWLAHLPATVELNAVQLPGRESRLRELSYTRMEPLIEALVPPLAALIDRPYALFGHSMGSWIAFELARALRRIGAPPPIALFVSARRAPQLPEPEPLLHTLANGPFVAAMIRRYNAIPRVLLEDIELLRLFLPTLRADLELIETYVYSPEPPLDCPIVALGGLEDPRAGVEDLAAWQAQTEGDFTLRQFPGDHFYLQGERAALVQTIVETLRSKIPAL